MELARALAGISGVTTMCGWGLVTQHLPYMIAEWMGAVSDQPWVSLALTTPLYLILSNLLEANCHAALYRERHGLLPSATSGPHPSGGGGWLPHVAFIN